MKRIKSFDMFETIKVPIKVGDTILGGRFKNKKIVVKKIGKNAKGDITINDKPLLKFRIIKENKDEEKLLQLIEDCLQDLADDGFNIDISTYKIDISISESKFQLRYFKFGDISTYIEEIRSRLEEYNVYISVVEYRKMDGWRSCGIEEIKDHIKNNDDMLQIILKLYWDDRVKNLSGN